MWGDTVSDVKPASDEQIADLWHDYRAGFVLSFEWDEMIPILARLDAAEKRVKELDNAIQDVHKTAFEGFAGHRQSCECPHCVALDGLFNVWSTVKETHAD